MDGVPNEIERCCLANGAFVPFSELIQCELFLVRSDSRVRGHVTVSGRRIGEIAKAAVPNPVSS